MKLGGQGELRLRERFRLRATRSGGQVGGQGGYAMATLLVSMSLMAIFMTVALPAWSQMAQREKETEYLFRANQYALAIKRCQMKQCGANGPAPSVDFLVEQKFLRKKYKDPLSGKDFVAVFQANALPGGAQQQGQAGSQFGAQGPSGPSGQQTQTQQPSSLATGKSLATDTLKVTASTPGGGTPQPLTGVTSASKGTAIRLFKGQQTTYDQWAVTVQDLGLHLGGYSVGSRFAVVSQAQQPGQQQTPGGQQPGASPFGQPQGTSGGFGSANPFGTPQGGGGGFGNQQGQSVFPQPPFGGGQGTGGQKPPTASPFGTQKPPQ
jgi:hypothetical protein